VHLKRRRVSRPSKREAARGGAPAAEPTHAPTNAPTNAPRAASGLAEGSGDGTKDDPEENRQSARAFLIAAAQAAVFVPALFYLHFGELDAFGLSFTVFVVVLCLLVALGYSVPDKPEHRRAAAPKRSLPGRVSFLARVGSFWLVACAFGPFFGWLVTAPEFAVTEADWWWRYAVRVALCVGLPVLTAVPLLACARGRYWYVVLPLLLGVTGLPVWSGANTLRDLREGPVAERATGFYDAARNSFYPAADGRDFRLTTLKHTQRTIKIEPAPPGEREE
jgi:hypothetical protein